MKIDRTCYKCGTDFQLQPHQKASNICTPCKNAYQKKYANKKSKVILDGYKDSYPYDINEKTRRFTQIRKKLDSMRDRSEWQQFFKDQLDNLDPKILIWIYDRRNQESLAEERVARNFKKDEYVDTRTTHNNTKSWFD